MIISAAVAGVKGSLPFFMVPMAEALGWSIAAFAGTHFTGVLVNGLTQPILGHLVDRRDARKLILISIAVAGLATVGLGFIYYVWHLIVLFGIVFSAAMGGASFGVLGPLAARWFLNRRTLALSLLTAASTMGSIFLNQSAFMVQYSYGWEAAWIALGAILLCLGLPLGWKFLRSWPSEMGLKPDGGAESPVEVRLRGSAPVLQLGRFEVERWWRAFRSPPILALLPVFAIGGFASEVSSRDIVSFVQLSFGVSTTEIMTALGWAGVLGAVGAVVGGWLADRFVRKWVLGAAFLAQGIAFLVLGITPGFAGVWLFAILYGLSGIVWMVAALSLMADIYGLRALATLWGIAFLFHSIGSVMGPVLVGLATGFIGYHLFFMACATGLVVAAVVSFAINERKYSARYQAAVEFDA